MTTSSDAALARLLESANQAWRSAAAARARWMLDDMLALATIYGVPPTAILAYVREWAAENAPPPSAEVVAPDACGGRMFPCIERSWPGQGGPLVWCSPACQAAGKHTPAPPPPAPARKCACPSLVGGRCTNDVPPTNVMFCGACRPSACTHGHGLDAPPLPASDGAGEAVRVAHELLMKHRSSTGCLSDPKMDGTTRYMHGAFCASIQEELQAAYARGAEIVALCALVDSAADLLAGSDWPTRPGVHVWLANYAKLARGS